MRITGRLSMISSMVPVLRRRTSVLVGVGGLDEIEHSSGAVVCFNSILLDADCSWRVALVLDCLPRTFSGPHHRITRAAVGGQAQDSLKAELSEGDTADTVLHVATFLTSHNWLSQ